MEKNKALVIPTVFDIGNHAINMETLKAMIKADSEILIKGIEDKEGYRDAVKRRAGYRTVAVEVEKKRLNDTRPIQKQLKDYKKLTDELAAEARKGEEWFDQQIKAVDEEKARIKKEEEERQQRLLLARINDLTSHGAQLVDNIYILPYSDAIEVPLDSIPDFDDNGWLIVLDAVIVAHQIEQERIETERKAKEKADHEAQAEKERLEEENRVMREKLAELEREQKGSNLSSFKEELYKEPKIDIQDGDIINVNGATYQAFVPTDKSPQLDSFGDSTHVWPYYQLAAPTEMLMEQQDLDNIKQTTQFNGAETSVPPVEAERVIKFPKTGVELISEERTKQVNKHGYDVRHDSEHVGDYDNEEFFVSSPSYHSPLLRAAYSFLNIDGEVNTNYELGIGDEFCEPQPDLPEILVPSLWPFEIESWKGGDLNKIERLTKAGALIAAEIDRLTILKTSKK